MSSLVLSQYRWSPPPDSRETLALESRVPKSKCRSRVAHDGILRPAGGVKMG